MVLVETLSSMRPLGIKKAKKLVKEARGGEGPSEISDTLKEGRRKNMLLRRAQLRFKCINALPNGGKEAKMLMDFLNCSELDGCGKSQECGGSSQEGEEACRKRVEIRKIRPSRLRTMLICG